jgi:uncharacterized protein
MNPTIEKFVQCKRLAVVGVSRSGKKFGNAIYQELKQRGYEVYAVNPQAQEINGQTCYTSLSSLPVAVEGVVICVKPQEAARVVREAADAGIRQVWLQQGAQSPEALDQAGALGITPVSGKCILMYAQPVRSFHAWHRGFANLLGKV